MAKDISADDSITAMKRELGAHGWVGMAWACLRLNSRYQECYEEFKNKRLSARKLCAEFGLGRPKEPAEAYEIGEPPSFVLARAVCPSAERGSRKVRVHGGQVALVIPLALPLDCQLRLLRRQLKQHTVAPPKLRSFDAMVELLAPRLVAYALATRAGWGPTKVGTHMFPHRPVAAAKTTARDLIERAEVFVESGYLTLAARDEAGEAHSKELGRKTNKAPAGCDAAAEGMIVHILPRSW